MKILYVAGKFRGANAWEVHKNVQEALKVGFEVAASGAMPLIPHSNTQPFDGTLGDQFWLDGTLELLRRSDAVMTVGNWTQSTGAKAEVLEAEALGKPVFHEISSLQEWLRSEANLAETVHVGVFDDDAEQVPVVMMCGKVLAIDEDANILVPGHDFYALSTFGIDGEHHTQEEISLVTCHVCKEILSRVLAGRSERRQAST
jgi:hypothetical protein